jgi:hypothetical protein
MSMVNETALALGSAALQEIKRRATPDAEWTNTGIGWIRSALNAKEWTIPCLDIKLRL